MQQDLPISDTFGNTWIKGISEIRHPDPVLWTPDTPGWIAVGVILSGVAFWLLVRRFRLWRRNAYRRRALAKLRRIEKQKTPVENAFLQALPPLLKETAVCAYPKSAAAFLTGTKWLEFLDKQAPGTRFADGIGRHLLAIAYQDPRKWGITPQEAKQLGSMVKHWIMRHRPEDVHA